MSGNLFIVAAPSGAGKSSLVNSLLAEDPNLTLSISYTTRAPRPGESEGREYHFVDGSTFEAMLERGDFLESALVHGNSYGTSQVWISDTRARGLDIILEIDWQGAAQIRRIFPEAISVFILPPSYEELERRLRKRGQDPEDTIQARLANAAEEIAHVAEFDYVIINNDFDEARRDLASVIRASRLRAAEVLTRLSAVHPDLFKAT